MEFGTMSGTCENTFNNADINAQEERGFSATSEIIEHSSGRKSFSKRRSACFDSLGVYFAA